ncbi:MAG: fibronectin type III domain-containing protein [Janthinobacterium lividum]
MRTSLGALVVVALVGTGLTTSTATADVTKPKVAADTKSGTALKVDWTDVKGAASYKVQYSTSKTFASATTLPAKGDPAISGSDTTLTGLTTDKTYFVRVADVSDSGKVGAYSAATEAKAAFGFEAPGDIFRTKVDRDSMTASWKAISGAPGYTVRVYSKGNPTKFFTTTTSSVNLTGLKASTTYYIRVYVVQPAAGSTNEVRLSDDSPEIIQATTSYKLATPDGLKVTSQSPTSVGLSWTAVAGAPDDAVYKVSYAYNYAQTDHQKTSGELKGTSGKLTGLPNDTTYFAVIYLVDKNGKRLTASSQLVTVKSTVPRGTISGKVDGVTGSDLTAAAYTTSGDVAQAVTVGSDNKYSLDVRPGSYKVQLMYTGGDNKASAWARSGSDGGWTFGAGSTIQVDAGKTTNAPDVEIKTGKVVSGKVVDPSGDAIRDVDLTAIAANGDERDVVSLTRSGSDGSFSLDGLGSGDYWIRASYSGDGFKTESVSLDVNKDLGVKVTLDTLPFRSKYGASMHGTRKVGKTMNVTATPWLAGTYPTTKAKMTFQWRRNGTAIKGATKSTYKLAGADRGKKLSVTATAKRYGYTTGSVTSTAKSIS